MMQAIREILHAHGYDSVHEMDVGSMIEVELGETMMPLVIEKIDDRRVSVAHYHTQRGDLMADPDIVFHVTQSGEWIPIEYTQHPHIYEHDPSGLSGAASFAETWDQNLKQQGYVAAAKGVL